MKRKWSGIAAVCVVCCTVLYATDSTTTVELPDTIAAGDYCEAVAQLPQNARAISGAQVLGCDWTWYNHSGNFISWESTYPMNVAERHGVRFEGQFVYVGEGSGPERIYDWELNVIDPNKTCDWSGYKIIPVDHSPFSPDFTGTTITTLSCPVVKRTFFSDLHETVCLAHDEQGNALIGRFIFTLLSFTAMPSTLPSPESEKRGTCPKCGGDVYGYEICVEALSLIRPWTTSIEMVDWEEKNDPNVNPDTLEAWGKRYGMVYEHEVKHKADYQKYYVDKINLSYNKFYCKYRFAYCVNAYPNHATSAMEDLKKIINKRYAAFIDSYKDTSAFDASVKTLDAKDYPAIKQALEDFGWSDECENPGEVWAFPIREPGK